MPKTLLTGTLEEQCAFLYNLAQEKMAAGNHAGASHALKEVLKYKPDYPGAAELMQQVKQAKREQTWMLWLVFGGAVIGVFFGTASNAANDLWLLGYAAAGAIAGFLIGNVYFYLQGRRRQTGKQAPVARD